jgi:hypothetical protein
MRYVPFLAPLLWWVSAFAGSSCVVATAFLPRHASSSSYHTPAWTVSLAVAARPQLTTTQAADPRYFPPITIDLPPSNSGYFATMKHIEPVVKLLSSSSLPQQPSSSSELIQVRRKIPLYLSVAPQSNGLAVCTRDGPPGTERVGDILRFISAWRRALPVSTDSDTWTLSLASAAGTNLTWQCTLFNIMKALTWEEVVEALLSNTEEHTDEVLMIWERPKNM